MAKKKTTKTGKHEIKYERGYILESRAERVLDLLRKTHIATKENCIRYSENMNKYISQNRFDTLLKLKYIVKTEVEDKETKEIHEVYKLAPRGKTYIKDNFENKSIYSSNSKYHDFKQSNFLFQHYQNKEIDTYKHEKELDYETKGYREGSRPDGLLINLEGEEVYIETITKNYSKEKIERKLYYCLIRNTKYHLNMA